MATKKETAVLNPNLGLNLEVNSIGVPMQALRDGLNFRISRAQLNNSNMGWTPFGITLNGPAELITSLTMRAGTTVLIFGSLTDLYKYSTGGGGTVTYITPTYTTGTVSASGTSVTGTGTLWNTTPAGSQWANAKAGDEISFGSTTVNSPTATWFKIDTVNSDTTLTLHTSAGTIGGGTSYTIRRKFTGGQADIWQTETFINASPQNEDQIFFTNGRDNVMRWNGTDQTVTVMTTFGFTCKTLIQFRNMMIYLNVVQAGTLRPTDMLNSDVGSPSNVGNASTNLAGQFRVHAGTNPILTAEKLGDYLAIYAKDGPIIMTYFTGDALVFIFRTAVQDKGPIATRGVSVFPDKHQFVGFDTLWEFDGSTARADTKNVWRQIIQTSDPVRQPLIYTFLDEQNGEQVWSVPSNSDPGSGATTAPPLTAWTEHYLEDTGMMGKKPYSKRTLPFLSVGYYFRQAGLTWDQLTNTWQSYNFAWSDQFFAASFPLILAGDVNGVIYTLNSGQLADGSPLNSFVRFGRRALVDGRMRGLLTRVYPFVNGGTAGQNLQVTVNLTDDAGGPITVNQTVAYDLSQPQEHHFVSFWRRGRWADITFGTSDGTPWVISGYDWDIRPGGYR